MSPYLVKRVVQKLKHMINNKKAFKYIIHKTLVPYGNIVLLYIPWHIDIVLRKEQPEKLLC